MPSVGSLFSGVGGFDMGFEAAGVTVAWQVENDRDAVSVLERHWPRVPRYGDIATVDGADLAPVDAVIGGFPCQDLSVAGKRSGLAGARSGLYWDAVRIVRQMREATGGRFPAFVVLENVPGLLSSDDGRDFAAVLGGLRELGAAVGYRILDARFFGVPQRRRRVFIVASFADVRSGAERTASVLSLVPSGSRHPETRGAAGQGAARDAADGAGGVGIADTVRSHPRPGSNSVGNLAFTLRGNTNGTGASDNAWNTTYIPELSVPLSSGAHPGSYSGQDASNDLLIPVAAFGGNNTSGPIDVATACNAHGGPHGRLDFESETFVVASPITASATPAMVTSGRGDGADNLVVSPEQGIAAPLTAGGHPNSNAPGRRREDDENLVAVAFDWQKGDGGTDSSFRGKSRSYVVRAGDYAGSLSATKHDAVAFHLTQDPINGAESRALGAGNEHGCSTVAVQSGMAVRRLTPRECERLMGWADDWTRYRADGSEIADGPRYRMIGNGVVAPVAAWIAERMLAVLEA